MSPTIDDYFELALDLPKRKRLHFLERLESEEPVVARQLRSLLATAVPNPDFACRSASEIAEQQRSRPELDTVHHLAVQVDDIESAVAWYRRRLDCEIAYQDQSWALLRFANLSLALQLPGRHPPHLAVARPDARRFGKLTEHRDRSRSVYLADPFGNAVQILDSDSLPTD